MLHRPFKTYPMLKPLAWLYQGVMAVRNLCFERGILHTETFPLPVVSVGNISVGGTGKTPMCAYLLGLLHANGFIPSLLSRGYGRVTKGFQKATPSSTASQVGDEPLELFRLYNGDIRVYVCEDRCVGARKLLADAPATDVLVLDDAYQHRYIHRDLNIMLTDYSRLYTLDKVMPEGRLRESSKGAGRADVIVVTKCPHDLSPQQADSIIKEINPLPRQSVFFTTIRYPEPVKAYASDSIAADRLSSLNALVLTGIAKPKPLIDHYTALCKSVTSMRFGDHHAFSETDITHIVEASKKADMVITTPKDFQRLSGGLPPALMQKLYVQHISIEFLFGRQGAFDSIILNTARKHLQG